MGGKIKERRGKGGGKRNGGGEEVKNKRKKGGKKKRRKGKKAEVTFQGGQCDSWPWPITHHYHLKVW